jgi:hypothetical protein
MAAHNTEGTILTGQFHIFNLFRDNGTLLSEDTQLEGSHYLFASARSLSPFSTASSIVPTIKKAFSGR